MKSAIEERLERLRLRIHDGKSRIYRCRDGLTFLGFRLFPDRTRLLRSNVVRFRRRLRDMQRALEAGKATRTGIGDRVRSWISHAAFGDTWRLRRRLFHDFEFPAPSAATWDA